MQLEINPKIEEILEKALKGRRIGKKEALILLNSKGSDAIAVGLVANKIREMKVGEVVTYVVNRNINFTNVCLGSCKFCAFKRRITDKDTYFLNISQIVEKVREAVNAGAKEVCIQGGLHPKIDLYFYEDLLRAIKKEVNVHVHAFSPMEIKYASEKSETNIENALKELKKAGLDSIPGTAAEILVDEVREKICPGKLKTKEWIRIVKEAHRQKIPTTATMLYGHVESPEDQIRHLSVIRDIQDETRGFTEFVPLSFVHFKAPLFLNKESKGGATGMEDFRLLSVSRIFLDNFKNIQASWVKLGRKLSQVMLNFGANDLGGTLMEENISRCAGLSREMLSEDEIKRMIIEAGRIPKERDTLYKLV
jgi:FO synthase subunit 2